MTLQCAALLMCEHSQHTGDCLGDLLMALFSLILLLDLGSAKGILSQVLWPGLQCPKSPYHAFSGLRAVMHSTAGA